MKHLLSILTLCAAPLIATPAITGDGVPTPEHVQFATGLSTQDAEEALETAQKYYAFWNTGNEDYAKAALSPDFIDLNLPRGRAQGPTGPLAASSGFRLAVPDLTLTVKSVYILKNKVIGRLQFDGHFTGAFGEVQGEGQAISFLAVDIYTIKDGMITENWHLEDNLTLLQQLGIADID